MHISVHQGNIGLMSFQVLWENGIMGKATPTALINALWWRNNFFGLRGRDEHHKLRWGDVSIEEDIDGTRFLLYKERDTKTRKDPSETRAIQPRIYETPETPETCPVNLLIEFTHRYLTSYSLDFDQNI